MSRPWEPGWASAVAPMPAVAPAMTDVSAAVTTVPTGVTPRGMPGPRVTEASVTNAEVAPGAVGQCRVVA